MSMLNDGREVRCDGAECKARTRWPIALHPVGRGAQASDRSAAGWLCVTGHRQHTRHYCPRCANEYLHSISNDLPRLDNMGKGKSGVRRAGGLR